MYLLLLPGLLYFILYRYVPVLGSVIAFQDYSPFQGFIHSKWVGFDNFKRIFADSDVAIVLWNTIKISFVQLFVVFPVPIILSLMLNEQRSQAFKRIVQSIVYLPHFISWVIVISIVTIFLRSEGLINELLHAVFGTAPIPFMTHPSWFIPLISLEVIWKESGWGTIIFLAALSGVNPQLYEAAMIDGASRWRQIWHITLPAIRSTIVILMILRLGTVLDVGFEQIFLMLNSLNQNIAQVLDTYVYYKGIQQADFSFASAVGLFKGIIGMILVVTANRLAKRFGEEGLY
jgi:putative aldouronate transport system permease protein